MALVRVELVKATKRLRTLIAFAVALGIPALIGVAVHSGDRRRRPDGLFTLTRQTGLVLPAVALSLMSAFFLVVIAAMFAGDTIAGEAASGNLRYLLLRPLSRARLLWVKALIAFVLTWVTTVAVTLSGLGVGVALFGWHPLVLPFGGAPLSTTTLLSHLMLATGYVAVGLTAVVAVGVFFSTLTDSPAGAIGGAVGLYIVADILDAVDPLGVLRYGLPTHYTDAWETLFTRGTTSHDLVAGVIVQAAWLVVFGALATWWFRRKDIAS